MNIRRGYDLKKSQPTRVETGTNPDQYLISENPVQTESLQIGYPNQTEIPRRKVDHQSIKTLRDRQLIVRITKIETLKSRNKNGIELHGTNGE